MPSLATILDNAIKGGLTVYDTSYLIAAVGGGHHHVTDDEELLRAAQRYLETSRSAELR